MRLTKTLVTAAALFLSLLAATAWAQPTIIGAGSLATDAPPSGAPASHAWFIKAETKGAAILHLPPRGIHAGATSIDVGSIPGEARVAAELRSMPEAAAARGSRLAMVFSKEAGDFPLLHGRTVLIIGAAQQTPDAWKTIPEGRMDALTPLRGDGSLLGFTGTKQGFAALFQGNTTNNTASSSLLLQLLLDDKWVDVPLPPEAITLAATGFEVGQTGKGKIATRSCLFATPDGVGLLILTPRQPSEPLSGLLFLGDLGDPTKTGTPSPLWTRREVLVTLPSSTPSEHVEAFYSGGELILTTAGSGKLRVFTQPLSQATSPWRQVGEAPLAAGTRALAVLDGVGRIAAFNVPPDKGAGKEPDRDDIIEVSARTGATFYNDHMLIASPITGSDYRMVGFVLAYAIGMVVVFLLRPAPAESLRLPAGVSLAEPGRRALASAIDASIALVVASRVMGVPVSDLFTLGVWGTQTGQDVALAAIGLLIVSGTLLETFVGRSLGKLLSGCGVVAMEKGPVKVEGKDEAEGGEAPDILHSLIRNIIKWGLPPIALLGLLDVGGRNRADQLAEAAVVIDDVEEEPEQ